jgi:hypothetical protein
MHDLRLNPIYAASIAPFLPEFDSNASVMKNARNTVIKKFTMLNGIRAKRREEQLA